jgi:hypothetical protein
VHLMRYARLLSTILHGDLAQRPVPGFAVARSQGPICPEM